MLKTKYDQFKQLHNEKEALILYNCWDVATALALEESGASAIATSSYALAQAWGFPDGQKMTFTEFYWFISRIASHVTKPFTVDIEAGYAVELKQLEANMMQLLTLDIVGVNFEDQDLSTEVPQLWTIAEQSARIQTIKDAAKKQNKTIFLNARTDIFFQNRVVNQQLMIEALNRTTAYANAGADCIFIPGLVDKKWLAYFIHHSPLPVNVMILPGLPSSSELQNMGAKRISYGPASYFSTMNYFQQNARKS